MPEPDLLTLQRWMSLIVRHPRDAAAAVRSRAAARLVPTGAALRGEVVTRSATMRPMARLDVYNGGYLTRLVEAMTSDFPGVLHALGDDGFRDLVRDYVTRHPSRHQNLIFLGSRLPDFIAGRKHLPHRAFLRDLARLEVAMNEAFHAPAFAPFDVSTLQALAPEDWSGAVFCGNPSLHLVETTYPVNRYLQAVFDEREPEIPARSRSRVAVYRKDFRVWRAGLGAEAFATLAALLRSVPFGEALRFAGREVDKVGGWFQDWAADGLFSEVIPPGHGPQPEAT